MDKVGAHRGTPARRTIPSAHHSPADSRAEPISRQASPAACVEQHPERIGPHRPAQDQAEQGQRRQHQHRRSGPGQLCRQVGRLVPLGPERRRQPFDTGRQARTPVDRHLPAGGEPREPLGAGRARGLPQRARDIPAEPRGRRHPGLGTAQPPGLTDRVQQGRHRLTPGPDLLGQGSAEFPYRLGPSLAGPRRRPGRQPPSRQRYRRAPGRQGQERLARGGQHRPGHQAGPFGPGRGPAA